MAKYVSDGNYVKTLDFTGGIYNYEPAAAIVGDEEDYVFNYDRLTAIHPTLGNQYLNILYMVALCFNMDRHTQNYGVLRNQSTGEVVCMAPNFDNNIALISRGYGQDAHRTNGFLINLFEELLTERGLVYQVPTLDEGIIRQIVQDTLPDEDIDRDYVANMVLERGQRLEYKMRQSWQQDLLGPDMKLT